MRAVLYIVLTITILFIFSTPLSAAERGVKELPAGFSYRPVDYREVVPFEESARAGNDGRGYGQLGAGAVFMGLFTASFVGLCYFGAELIEAYFVPYYIPYMYFLVKLAIGFFSVLSLLLLAGGVVFLLYGAYKYRRWKRGRISGVNSYNGYPAMGFRIVL